MVRWVRSRNEFRGVDAGRNDGYGRIEPARVLGKVGVAGHHVIAVANDRRDFSWPFERLNYLVGLADVRQKNRVVEVEDQRRTAPHRQQPFNDRWSNRKQLAIQQHRIKVRDVAQRGEVLQRQRRESRGLLEIVTSLVDEAKKVGRE